MRSWLTSDTHFGHENIIRYCGRPYTDAAEMNFDMIRRWNDTVSAGDIVYHLGDFAMGQPHLWAEYRRRLLGRIVLVRGNHDRNADFMRDVVGIDEVLENAVLEIDGTRCWVNHYPPEGTDWHGAKKVRPHALEPYDLALCGHIHEKWKVAKGCVNVGVDQWNFRPITVEHALAARAEATIAEEY